MDFLEIKRKLGQGGFGSVYLAYDKLLNQEVAVKILNSNDHPLSPHMLTKEIEALRKLKHKNIVKMFNSFPLPKKQQILVVMEYLKGGELFEYWDSKKDKILPEDEAKEIILQITEAIEYCHNNKIIHRDLKFQNILLTHVPNPQNPTLINTNGDKTYNRRKSFLNSYDINLRIVDFGVFGSTRGQNGEKSNAGSLKYMPPEVLLGFTESTPKIDVWAIGIMLHALVIGNFPFRSSSREELKRLIIEKEILIDRKQNSISDQCFDIMTKMLDKDPQKRISIQEILDHPWLNDYRKQKKRHYYGIFGNDEYLDDYEQSTQKLDQNSKTDGQEYSDEFTNEEEKTPTTNVDEDQVAKGFNSPQGDYQKGNISSENEYFAVQQNYQISQQSSNGQLRLAGQRQINDILALKKKMTMDINRNNSYSPEKRLNFQNATATQGFGLSIKKTTNLTGFQRDITPGDNNTPQSLKNHAFANILKEGKSNIQSELKFPEIVNSSGLSIMSTTVTKHNSSFNSEKKISLQHQSLSTNRQQSTFQTPNNPYDQKFTLKIQSKNVQLLDPYAAQPNFLRPIGQTRWQKQLTNLSKDLSIKLLQQSHNGQFDRKQSEDEEIIQPFSTNINDENKSELKKSTSKRRKTILERRANIQQSGLNSSRAYDESKISHHKNSQINNSEAKAQKRASSRLNRNLFKHSTRENEIVLSEQKKPQGDQDGLLEGMKTKTKRKLSTNPNNDQNKAYNNYQPNAPIIQQYLHSSTNQQPSLPQTQLKADGVAQLLEAQIINEYKKRTHPLKSNNTSQLAQNHEENSQSAFSGKAANQQQQPQTQLQIAQSQSKFQYSYPKTSTQMSIINQNMVQQSNQKLSTSPKKNRRLVNNTESNIGTNSLYGNFGLRIQ